MLNYWPVLPNIFTIIPYFFTLYNMQILEIGSFSGFLFSCLTYFSFRQVYPPPSSVRGNFGQNIHNRKLTLQHFDKQHPRVWGRFIWGVIWLYNKSGWSSIMPLWRFPRDRLGDPNKINGMCIQTMLWIWTGSNCYAHNYERSIFRMKNVKRPKTLINQQDIISKVLKRVNIRIVVQCGVVVNYWQSLRF